MPKVLKFPVSCMAAVWCVAVLTIVSAPLSRAADTAKEKLQEGEEPQPAPETDFQAEVSMSITLVNVLAKVAVVAYRPPGAHLANGKSPLGSPPS